MKTGIFVSPLKLKNRTNLTKIALFLVVSLFYAIWGGEVCKYKICKHIRNIIIMTMAMMPITIMLTIVMTMTMQITMTMRMVMMMMLMMNVEVDDEL